MNKERTSISILGGSVSRQEGKYRRFIEDNDGMGTRLAMRLAHGGQLDNLLGGKISEEYRQSLKTMAKDNVAKERQLKANMKTIEVVVNNNSNSNDFHQQMEVVYTKELKTIENDSVMVTQEPTYLKLCEQLGEEENQDDELAAVNRVYK